MVFTFTQKVLFKHCDPAGIVFYPRYFEMINDCIEAFFSETVRWPFEDMHKKGGIPTAEISSKFTAPSRHGDQLSLCLSVTQLGHSSLEAKIEASSGEEKRFITKTILVHVNEKGRPAAWPKTHKTKLEEFMRSSNA
jgi:4-hydroxybenzoyl-CoA thioesterase